MARLILSIIKKKISNQKSNREKIINSLLIGKSLTPKIYICHEEITGPWGGSNQFTRFFKDFIKEEGAYADDPERADVIFFVSHLNLNQVIKLKRKYPKKLFLHRIDGPTRLYNHKKDKRDALIYWANSHIADATIFQSKWSREKNCQMGMSPKEPSIVVLNATSGGFFNRSQKTPLLQNEDKVKLVMVSWSRNMNKGFATYQWLDDHLDRNRYTLSFVGNTPVEFKNTKCYLPMASDKLSDFLKSQDIYITASEKDPCSNALIEAMSCGLPALAKNDGGHPEIVKKGGELFDKPEQIPVLLERMVEEYDQYQARIALPTMEETGGAYLDFITEVLNQPSRRAKKLTRTALFQLRGMTTINWLKRS